MTGSVLTYPVLADAVAQHLAGLAAPENRILRHPIDGLIQPVAHALDPLLPRRELALVSAPSLPTHTCMDGA